MGITHQSNIADHRPAGAPPRRRAATRPVAWASGGAGWPASRLRVRRQAAPPMGCRRGDQASASFQIDRADLGASGAASCARKYTVAGARSDHPSTVERHFVASIMLSTISATRWGSLPPNLGDDLAPFNYRASNQIRPKFAQNPQFRRIRQLMVPGTKVSGRAQAKSRRHSCDGGIPACSPRGAGRLPRASPWGCCIDRRPDMRAPATLLVCAKRTTRWDRWAIRVYGLSTCGLWCGIR